MKRNYVLLYLSTTKFLLYKGWLPLLNIKALVFVLPVLYNGAFPPIYTTMKLLEDFPRSLAKFLNCLCGMIDWGKVFSLITSQDHCQRPHHHKSLTWRKQDLNLCRTWVLALYAVVTTTTLPDHSFPLVSDTIIFSESKTNPGYSIF